MPTARSASQLGARYETHESGQCRGAGILYRFGRGQCGAHPARRLDAGYKAEIQPSSEGRPNIRSAAEGTEFSVYQYDCKQDVCGSLQFSVGFDTKGAFKSHDMNEWNRNNRWVRAFTDDVHDPWLAQDVDLSPGVSYENLNDEFTIWRSSLKRFRDELHQ